MARPGPTSRIMRLPFPGRGVVDVLDYKDVPPPHILRALNVVPTDMIEGRQRGGKRPGTGRIVMEPLVAGRPVFGMTQVTLNSPFVSPELFFTDPRWQAGVGGALEPWAGGWGVPRPEDVAYGPMGIDREFGTVISPLLRSTILATRPADMLSLYWLNALSGDIVDGSPHGMAPTLVRTAAGTWTYGEPGADATGPDVTRSIRHVGSTDANQWFASPSVAHWNAIQTGNFTIMLIFKVAGFVTTANTFFSLGIDAGRFRVDVRTFSLRHAMSVWTGWPDRSFGYTEPVAPVLNVWRMFTMIRSGASLRIIMDGVTVASTDTWASANPPASTMPLSLFATESGGPLNGWIQGSAIWNVALTDDEVAAIYARVAR